MSFYRNWILITLATFSAGSKDLNEFLQPDDVGDLHRFAPSSDPKSCNRQCVKGQAPRLCYYRFYLEDYRICGDCPQNKADCYNNNCVTADGYDRSMLAVNRRLPGPSMQVCKGDRIVVDVENMMAGRSTTIHWHGIFQEGTPYNDGVPMISQCPILEGNIFRYDFFTKQEGTYFWHSHDGAQKADGVQGSLIIRQPKEDDPNSNLYDYDLPAHVVFMTDWYHTTAAEHLPGLVNPDDPASYETYYLINGRGRYVDPVSGNATKTPYSVFRVKPGKRYRFRFIGATCSHCHTRISVEGHQLTLIAVDGNAVKPVVADSFNIFSGERYDFVLNAKREVKSYWILATGIGPCTASKIYQLAILEYEGSNELEPQSSLPKNNIFNSEGVVMNAENATCGSGQKGVCVSQLENAEKITRKISSSGQQVIIPVVSGYFYPSVESLESKTHQRFVLPDPTSVDTVLWINNIYMKTPESPILSQLEDIPSDDYCNKSSKGVPGCEKDLCSCINLMNVPLGAEVFLVFIDKSDSGGLNHPFHIHGQDFEVLSMGYISNGPMTLDHIEELLKSKKLEQSSAPARKDTIAVPSTGYAVVRFVANNPGVWLVHCHFVLHHIVGMSMALQVGESTQQIPVPKGFPRCGNYLPALEKEPQQTSIFRKIVDLIHKISKKLNFWN